MPLTMQFRLKCPSTNTRKREIQEWLRHKKVNFMEGMTKTELLNKPVEPTYEIDDIIRDRGHKVVRLPPYRCDLDPIELI